jgi:hypothetical protein
MKKTLAILSLVLFIFVGCQDSATIVSPENGASLEKDTPENVLNKDGEDGDSQDIEDPWLPRI